MRSIFYDTELIFGKEKLGRYHHTVCLNVWEHGLQ